MLVQLFQSRSYFYKKHYSLGFQRMARLITGLGLAYWTIQAFAGRLRGNLTRRESGERLKAYRRIWRLK